MPFSSTQNEQLSAKLNASHVKKNPKGFDYVEGWHAINEANRIFGFDAWSREVINLKFLCDPYKNDNDNWVINYGCTVRVTVTVDGTTVTRDGCGFGSGISKDMGSAHESAIKEAETDAMKRSLMTFGNPFGLALYDKKKADVAPASDPKADEQYVAGAIDWMQRQTIAGEIYAAWSKEMDRFLSLPFPLQQRLTSARDEVLARIGKPQAETQRSPSQEDEDFKIVADQIKRQIDEALDSLMIRDILDGKPMADLAKHSKSAAAFLTDRANKKLGTIMQGRKAA